jgi:hypothetical protein
VINVESGDSQLHLPEVSVLEGNGQMLLDVSSINPEVSMFEADKGQMPRNVSSINPEVGVFEDDKGQMPRDGSYINPEVGVFDDNKGQMSNDVSNIDSQVELKENPLSCSARKFSKELVHDFNMTNESEFSILISPDHILGTESDKDITVPSPVIGRQKLSPQVRSFCHRNGRKKRRRKVNDAIQQVVHCQGRISPALDSHRNDRKGLCQLNQEKETELDLKNNVRLTAINTDLSHISDRNEMLPVLSSQQTKTSQSNVVSPVMKCGQKWHKQKHSVKISHLGENCCDVVNKPDKSRLQVSVDVVKDGYTEANMSTVGQILTPSSPVLGRSKKKFRRAKIMMAAKSEDCTHDKKMQDLSVVSSVKDVLLRGCSIDNTSQQNDMNCKFDNDYPITLQEERQSGDDEGLKESQKYENYDVLGVGAKGASRRKENVKELKGLKCSEAKTDSVLFLSEYSIEADVTVETECSGIDIKKCDRPSSLDIGKVLSEDGQCGRKSVNVDSDVLFPGNIIGREDSVVPKGKEPKCNAEVKEECPDAVMSSELLIETETSLEISVNHTSEHHNDVAQVNSYLIKLCVASCTGSHCSSVSVVSRLWGEQLGN